MSEADPDRARPALAAQLGAAVTAGTAQLRAALADWRAREAAVVERPAHGWWVAAALAVLLAAGPLATIAGANLLAGRARAEAQRLEAVAAPQIAADKAAAQDRAELGALLRRPGVGAAIEALARALPPESALVRAGRDVEGMLTIEISTPDPDKLRTALRREPMLAGLHDSGQRQGEGTMVVTLVERAP